MEATRSFEAHPIARSFGGLTWRASAVLVATVAACATAASREVAPLDSGRADAPRSSRDGAGGDAARDASVVAGDATADARMGGCATPFSGTLATWTFTGAAGNQAMTLASSTAPGVTASAFARAAALTPVTGTNSINSSNWTTSAAPDPAKYYTLSLQAPVGCAVTLTSMSIDAKASTTGPTNAGIASSTDAFAQPTAISTSASSSPMISVTAPGGALELRVLGYGATSAAGTLRVQGSLSIDGSLW
jgi:hypothetical protein